MPPTHHHIHECAEHQTMYCSDAMESLWCGCGFNSGMLECAIDFGIPQQCHWGFDRHCVYVHWGRMQVWGFNC